MKKEQFDKNEHLTPHFTLGEMCRTNVQTGEGNLPPSADIVENLRRLCDKLEQLRSRYNERYVLGSGGVKEANSLNFLNPLNSSNLLEEPIVINSGYRSAAVNKAVGGSKTSNHLTGCAADIRVSGIEQALRYAVILMDVCDEDGVAFDELLIERNARGTYWLHFALRPPEQENRRRIKFIADRSAV